MDLKKTLFIFFIIFILSVGIVSAADLNNTYVSESLLEIDNSDFNALGNVNIENSELSASAGSFAELQAEINNAQSGSVLSLTRDYYGGEGSVVTLNKDLTIDGQGHTIDCLNKEGCSAFSSNSGNIILKNLIIINGNNNGNSADDDTYKGGAIIITGSAQYTLENCVLKDNFADDYGGAIYNGVDKPLTIKDCEFSSNRADDENGGAICSVGDVNIVNSVFSGNFAAYRGGAVFSNNNVTVDKCTFVENKAKNAATFVNADGGAIYADVVNVNNSTFRSNFASDEGGAIFAYSYIYINYNQKNTQYINTFFYSNEADIGGAISTIRNSANIKNTLFFMNEADENGGAIFATGSNLYLNHCTFQSNTATDSVSGSGGAITAHNNIDINNCTFIDNKASSNGGAIYLIGNPNVVLNINANQNPNQDYNTFFINNIADDDDGGAIWISGTLNAVNTKFEGNSAEHRGGAVYGKYGNDIHATHSLFSSNYASGDAEQCKGGAIYSELDVYIDACDFQENWAYDYGGAIYNVVNFRKFF